MFLNWLSGVLVGSGVPISLVKYHVAEAEGVRWKQGVVVCIVLQAVLLHNATPIHCTPFRLHPPEMNTQMSRSRIPTRPIQISNS